MKIRMVETNFINLDQWISGNLNLKVIKSLKVNGITSFGKRNLRSTVTIKRGAALSNYICWMMAIVIHELGHVLHYFNSNGQILKGKEYGKEGKNIMTSAIRKNVSSR